MTAFVMLSRTTLISRSVTCQVPKVIGSLEFQKRDSSTGQLTDYRRGRGGRASFSGDVVTVFGASGFLGRYVVGRLGRDGSQVIVPYRLDVSNVDLLKLCGDLGQILFTPMALNDEESIYKAMKYSNTVVNLIGRDFKTRNFSYDQVHVEGARRIARIAKETGVKKFIHFSSLNASPNPQKIFIKGGSNFLKSKHYGELAVREEFPEATIFRPADIFGPEDRFYNIYTKLWRRAHASLPLWKKGDYTIKQPVFVGDVAKGVVLALRNPNAVGQTYEAVGPHRYYLADLVKFFYDILRHRSVPMSRITPLFQLKARIMGMAPSNPLYNMEKLDKDSVTDVLTGCPTLEDLGVELTRIEGRAFYDLFPYRTTAYYAESVGEFPKPKLPPVVVA